MKLPKESFESSFMDFFVGGFGSDIGVYQEAGLLVNLTGDEFN
jgi:hypothetical protein